MYNSILLFMSGPFFPLHKVCSDQHSLHLSSTASSEFLEIISIYRTISWCLHLSCFRGMALYGRECILFLQTK